MAEFESFVCETRYCPECGTEIFCRTDSGDQTIYYLSREMNYPVSECPQCNFELIGIPLEMLADQPEKATGKRGPTMTKQQAGEKALIEAVLQKAPEAFETKAGAKRALDAAREALVGLLSSGHNVRWSGVGSFKIRERNPRKGRNPQTGEELQIPAKRVIAFSPAKALSQKLNSQ